MSSWTRTSKLNERKVSRERDKESPDFRPDSRGHTAAASSVFYVQQFPKNRHAAASKSIFVPFMDLRSALLGSQHHNRLPRLANQ
jgi:hypothetical protein